MMDVKIYQINLDRDENGVAFISHGNLSKYQERPDVDASLYDKVFEGEIEAEDLEDVYRMFNMDKPEKFAGRSLSVSDVVEVVKSDEVKSGFYYCDSIGFQNVPFDSTLAHEMQNPTITVVLCEPGKAARTAEVGTSLEALQAVVDGCIEAYYPFEEQVCIVCNDEGKLNGMSPCRAIYGEDKQMIDIIFGPFVICDCSGENFGSLSEEQLARYTEQFKNPERYFRMDGEIKAVVYEPKLSEHAR